MNVTGSCSGKCFSLFQPALGIPGGRTTLSRHFLIVAGLLALSLVGCQAVQDADAPPASTTTQVGDTTITVGGAVGVDARFGGR